MWYNDQPWWYFPACHSYGLYCFPAQLQVVVSARELSFGDQHTVKAKHYPFIWINFYPLSIENHDPFFNSSLRHWLTSLGWMCALTFIYWADGVRSIATAVFTQRGHNMWTFYMDLNSCLMYCENVLPLAHCWCTYLLTCSVNAPFLWGKHCHSECGSSTLPNKE
jgi:hypothetical protein